MGKPDCTISLVNLNCSSQDPISEGKDKKLSAVLNIPKNGSDYEKDSY